MAVRRCGQRNWVLWSSSSFRTDCERCTNASYVTPKCVLPLRGFVFYCISEFETPVQANLFNSTSELGIISYISSLKFGISANEN